MQATCPNPGCGAVYTVEAQHVGHRSTCKKCGAAFIIEADGLRAAEATVHHAPTPVVQAERAPAGSPAASGGERAGSLLGDPFTWLLAAGTIVILLFTIFPTLDHMKISRYNALISAERNRDSSTFRRPTDEPADTSKIKDLQESLKDARTSAQTNPYWYTWFMLGGFLILTAGGLGYLFSPSSKTKRIIGAIVLIGQLLILSQLAGGFGPYSRLSGRE